MYRRALWPLLVAAAACGPTDFAENPATGTSLDAAASAADAWPAPPPVDEMADAAPVEACDRMDILFVVDNSGSMLEEQQNLADNFPRFIEVLDAFVDGDLDYRVGITTTGRDYTYYIDSPIGALPTSQTGGDNGALLQRCDMSRPWIERTDADRIDTFACAAQVGDEGPSMEMPLAVVREAFTDRVNDGSNAGFLRQDALLAIVVLTDEDDCSYEEAVTLGMMEVACEAQVEPVQSYASFLDTLTGGAGRWALAVIAGAGPGSCTSEFGDAQEATRLADLVELAGDNGVLSSICEGDLAGALEEALATFDTACQDFPPID